MSNNKHSFTDYIIDGLKNAANEIEELRLQLALGKAEARDLYEEVKRKFSTKMQQAKSGFDNMKDNDDVRRVINALEYLQVQLSLGMAETAELFEEQREKIRKAIAELEAHIKNDPKAREFYAEMKLEAEKFRLKLELLALHYKLSKIKTEYNFEKSRETFLNDLEDLRSRMKNKEEKLKDKFSHFQEEMTEAFRHLKKAFE